MADTDQQEDQHLPAYPSKADFAGQFVIRCRAHDAGDIVHHHEQHKCIQQTVAAAEEIPQPAANPGEDHLNRCPKFLHVCYLSFFT